MAGDEHENKEAETAEKKQSDASAEKSGGDESENNGAGETENDAAGTENETADDGDEGDDDDESANDAADKTENDDADNDGEREENGVDGDGGELDAGEDEEEEEANSKSGEMMTQEGASLVIEHPFIDDENSQESRDILLMRTLKVHEKLDSLFQIEAHVVSEKTDLVFEDIVGKEVGFTIVQEESNEGDASPSETDAETFSDDEVTTEPVNADGSSTSQTPGAKSESSGDSESDNELGGGDDEGAASGGDDDGGANGGEGDGGEDPATENLNMGDRYFHGIVTDFMQYATTDPDSNEITRYELRVAPKLWLLTLSQDCRVFQNITPLDIIKTILQEHEISDCDFQAEGGSTPREYCIQYNETHYDFICRLMEEEGICHYFVHGREKGGGRHKHILVLSDKPDHFKDCIGSANLSYDDSFTGISPLNVVTHCDLKQRVASLSASAKDYNMTNASNHPYSKAEAEGVNETLVGGRYEYPGQMDQDDMPTMERVETLMGMRLEEYQRLHKGLFIKSTAPYLSAGGAFKLSSHYREDLNDKRYLVYEIFHEIQSKVPEENDPDQVSEVKNSSDTIDIPPPLRPLEGEAELFDDIVESPDRQFSYRNTVIAFHDELPYRPKRKRVLPRIHSVQSAIVTGPEGEEIFTDEYGRIRIKFLWEQDREKTEVDDDSFSNEIEEASADGESGGSGGALDDGGGDDSVSSDTAGGGEGSEEGPGPQTSCWVRVQQGWAGNNWGILFTPRIGMEVLVSFINGNPNRPVITGCLYNSDHMPPYLPERITDEHTSTKSGFKTKSTPVDPDADEEAFNEFRFEDKAGEEQIYTRAQKDFDVLINENETRHIKKGSSWLTIGHGDRRVILEGGGEAVEKTSPDGQELPAGEGNDSLILNTGSRSAVFLSENEPVTDTTYIEDGRHELHIKKGNNSRVLEEGDDKETIIKGHKKTFLKEGNDFTEIVMGNLSSVVKIGDRTHEIETGSDKTYIHTGNHETYIEAGDKKLKIDSGNQLKELTEGHMKTTLTSGNYVLDLTEGNQEITLEAGNRTLTITGNNNEEVDGDYVGDYTGNYTLTVGGDFELAVTGDIKIATDANLEVAAGGDIKMEAGGDFKIEAGGDFLVENDGDLKLELGGDLKAESGGDMKFESGGDLDLESSTDLNLTGGGDLNAESSTAMVIKSGDTLELNDTSGLTISSGGDVSAETGAFDIEPDSFSVTT